MSRVILTKDSFNDFLLKAMMASANGLRLWIVFDIENDFTYYEIETLGSMYANVKIVDLDEAIEFFNKNQKC